MSRLPEIEALFPLFNWLNQPYRILSLLQRFFKKVAMELSALPEIFKLKWKDLESQTGQKAATICTF
jgi:hypothetical protein